MSFEIPHHWDPKIEEIAEARQVTQTQAVDLILQAGIEILQPMNAGHRPSSYASLFGAAAGPGALGSREAVETYLAELRNE